MAVRMCFVSTPNSKKLYSQKAIDFTYYSGFALSQKQKCIASLHENIKRFEQDLKVLEISTKSTCELGVRLSAFNLLFYDKVSNMEYPLENIFQSSKKFALGGPYKDLLDVSPKDAKRDERLRTSGKLVSFEYDNYSWELFPRTMFYDWIYLSGLTRYEEIANEILNYNAFTDIEFNHNKSINSQARSAAIFVSLKQTNKLQKALNNKDFFKSLY